MIPKIIHFCWLSGEPYPKDIEMCINSWKKYLPDYKIILWNKENFDVNSIQWVKESYEAKKYAFASDYIRFWCLYYYGGIYLDSDVEIINSLDMCLDAKSFIGFEYLGIPEAAVLGAEKGTEWIKRCLDYYDGRSFYDDEGNMRNDVVPKLVRVILNSTAKRELKDIGRVQNLGWINLYPYTFFSPKNYYNGKIEMDDTTVSIHRFASAWGPKKKRKVMVILHEYFIKVFGKKYHDIIYRYLKPYPDVFNRTKIGE